jgi:Flp pilus assembly protein TadD
MKKLIILAVCISGLFRNVQAQTEAKDFALADSLIKSDQYEKGLELLNKLINSYGEKEEYLSDRGLAYLATNDAAKARADFLKALALNPECTRCLGNLHYGSWRHEPWQ